ncbi:hypothetical protein GCM10010342_56640 [Streptomyces anulatus]|nr:hypothetical protein GCM10010342_56640 [Streptomyces anulatus]
MVIRRALGSGEVHDGTFSEFPYVSRSWAHGILAGRGRGRSRRWAGRLCGQTNRGEESFKRSGRGEWIATAAPHPLFFGRQLAVQALTTFSCATGPVRHNLEQFEQRQLFGAGLQHPIE